MSAVKDCLLVMSPCTDVLLKDEQLFPFLMGVVIPHHPQKWLKLEQSFPNET